MNRKSKGGCGPEPMLRHHGMVTTLHGPLFRGKVAHLTALLNRGAFYNREAIA